MAWRILATAGTNLARVTLYLSPDGHVWLRALGRSERLHESEHASVEEALLEAAARPELPGPLYNALLDAVERQARFGTLGGADLPWKPCWPEE